MRTGIPTEIEIKENRVICSPGGARMFVQQGSEALVLPRAGLGSGFSDEHYRLSGATVVPAAADAWAAELVVKVKEPQHGEYRFLRPGLVLYTYLHLAAEPTLATRLIDRCTCGIAYETAEVGPRHPCSNR